MPEENLISDRQRLQLELPLLKAVQLSLWADSRGKNKIEMGESIIIDRVSNSDNWADTCASLRQKAAISGESVNTVIAAIVEREKLRVSSPETVNWMPLLTSAPATSPDIENLSLESLASLLGVPEEVLVEKLRSLLD